jgi:hypothetical protein
MYLSIYSLKNIDLLKSHTKACLENEQNILLSINIY